MTVITLRLKLQHESQATKDSDRSFVGQSFVVLPQLCLEFFLPFFKHSREPKQLELNAPTFCSLFLHDVVMRIQFSFLLKSEPISWWCQFRNWDTLYFFVTSLYDHFIRCWAMLHTSGLVTVKKPFQKIDFSILFFITKLRAKRAT